MSSQGPDNSLLPEVVKYSVSAGAATLTLDSPHNRNAISALLVGQLLERLDEAERDPNVRVVVLSHTGNTFCAGADLSEASSADMPTDPVAAATRRTEQMAALLRRIVALPKPVVACIDGHVRAGGLGLIAACDVVVAGPHCSFAVTEARLGLAPSVISLTLLPRLNARAASRYFLSGEKFDSSQAEKIGLVTLAVTDTEVAVTEILANICKASPQGLAATKALTTAEIIEQIDRKSGQLAADSARLFSSEEAREGMLAFLQKRDPRWAV
ncbi:MAG: enoyl-CoA hydratase family protein [Mycobacteriaceae bacterium]